MRIDKYLKVSRLIKRRTVAQDACSAGKVEVNGKSVKAGYTVKLEDEISIRFGAKTITVKVKDIKETVKKEQAQYLYEVIGE